jgi:hypothetical protein
MLGESWRVVSFLPSAIFLFCLYCVVSEAFTVSTGLVSGRAKKLRDFYRKSVTSVCKE